MSLKTSLPTRVRPLVRQAYVRVGSATARHRALPDAMVIGGQRCGTTSLFRALSAHPGMVRPSLNKGVNYFDLNYHRGMSWYAGHFPLRATVRRRGADRATSVFEASGYYIFHPAAAERIARDLPQVKLIAMLRDPVERAYSAWKHESARGFDDVPFERALELEETRIAGEAERMLADTSYASDAFRHHAYAERGDYVAQLERFRRHFPAAQIHVVYSEDFFARPVEEFGSLCDFLGVERFTDLDFEVHNSRPSTSMPAAARERLEAAFADQIPGLTSLVGRRPPWSFAGSSHE